MNNIKKICILLSFILISIPSFSFAVSPTLANPEGAGTSEKTPLITCGNDKNPCDANDLNALILNIIKLVFLFAGFIVAGMFMYAGFLLITAAGNTSQIQKAKDIFRRVVIGFLIMFLSYITVKNLLKHINAIEFFQNIIK